VRCLVLTIALLGSVLPATAGTVGSKELKEVHRTSRVTYYASKGHSVDVKRTEAFLDRLVALFGPTPGGWRVQYYLHDSAHVVHPELGLSAYGVTDLDTLRIDSVRAYHPHELVHAMAGPMGRPPLLFAEGLAVALTSEGRWRGGDLDQVALAALGASRSARPFLDRFSEQDPDAAYAVAGSLVGYLFDRYGIEPFVAFLRGCSVDSGRYEAAFQRAYGRTVTRATLEWERSLREPSRSAREWYDPASWPRSLQRDGTALAAGSQQASVVTAAAVAEAEPGGRRPEARDLGRVLDIQPTTEADLPALPSSSLDSPTSR
jgi:hypothetical protein